MLIKHLHRMVADDQALILLILLDFFSSQLYCCRVKVFQVYLQRVTKWNIKGFGTMLSMAEDGRNFDEVDISVDLVQYQDCLASYV